MKTLNINYSLKVALAVCCFSLFMSCEKPIPLNEKYVGFYTLENKFKKDAPIESTQIIAGDEDNIIIWFLHGQKIELEIYETSSEKAFTQNFSLPLVAEDKASVTFIDANTLEGHKGFGSIFLKNYKSEFYKMTRK